MKIIGIEEGVWLMIPHVFVLSPSQLWVLGSGEQDRVLISKGTLPEELV